MNFPWYAIAGRGSHLRATPHELIIERERDVKRVPLSEIRHLLVVGTHHLNTSVIIQLIRTGSMISFFDTDGHPVGHVAPFGFYGDEEMREVQKKTPSHRYAVVIVRGAMNARLLFLQRLAEERDRDLFYKGEVEFLHRARDEVEYLIKMDELRRMHRLTSDMYYEILSRKIPSELGFRRRTRRPHHDPVNAMFSFGYSILHGACSLAVVGAHLDPGIGLLSEGTGSLVQDLMEPLKPTMVDVAVVATIHAGILPHEFDAEGTRCHLSEGLIERLVSALRLLIDQDRINTHVLNFKRAVLEREEFTVTY